MAKIDEIKELIGFLKVLFATFVAVDVSMIAWLYRNHSNNTLLINTISAILIVLFSIGIILVVAAILKNIRNLKDL